jgi:hypothetical protein
MDGNGNAVTVGSSGAITNISNGSVVQPAPMPMNGGPGAPNVIYGGGPAVMSGSGSSVSAGDFGGNFGSGNTSYSIHGGSDQSGPTTVIMNGGPAVMSNSGAPAPAGSFGGNSGGGNQTVQVNYMQAATAAAMAGTVMGNIPDGSAPGFYGTPQTMSSSEIHNHYDGGQAPMPAVPGPGQGMVVNNMAGGNQGTVYYAPGNNAPAPQFISQGNMNTAVPAGNFSGGMGSQSTYQGGTTVNQTYNVNATSEVMNDGGQSFVTNADNGPAMPAPDFGNYNMGNGFGPGENFYNTTNNNNLVNNGRPDPKPIKPDGKPGEEGESDGKGNAVTNVIKQFANTVGAQNSLNKKYKKHKAPNPRPPKKK